MPVPLVANRLYPNLRAILPVDIELPTVLTWRYSFFYLKNISIKNVIINVQDIRTLLSTF